MFKQEFNEILAIQGTSSDEESQCAKIYERSEGEVPNPDPNISTTTDDLVQPPGLAIEITDEFYDRLPPHRKLVIVALLSYCSFLSPISSTSVLAAIPEIAEEYDTSGSIVNVSNAVYMIFMGISPVFWGPMSQVYGRKNVSVVAAVLFFLCSIGTALSPNLTSFFIFRVLTAFEGTAFMLAGSACISDIYRPTERGTAMGWFLSGTLIGPALGPLIGGIIVTYTSWRVVFWLQTALAGLSTLGTLLILPETILYKKANDLKGLPRMRKIGLLCSWINPGTVLKLYRYPNLIAVGMAAASVVWNMYALLAPIRYILNPRFNLTTPMQGGLFYLAPGLGYVAGSFIGGRYADYIVKKWIRKRDGVRVPEDRLRSCIPFMGIVIPGCILIYAWGVDREVGGIPLVVITLFIQGVAQLFCFPSYNTYCLDVMQGRGAEVMAGNYFVRYLFAGVGTAVILPATETIGVGWANTISVVFIIMCTIGTMATIKWGRSWRERIDQRGTNLGELVQNHECLDTESARSQSAQKSG